MKTLLRALQLAARTFLLAVLVADTWIAAHVLYHWHRSGWVGVRAWIAHIENIGGPAVWREQGDPCDIAIRSAVSAYEHFMLLCLVLAVTTWLAFRLHKLLTDNWRSTRTASASQKP